jgi:predicted phosphoribosyltransferase
MRYVDRVDAGRKLAPRVASVLMESDQPGESPLVLGVPRGGVVVAYEVARALRCQLEVTLARKLGAPHNPELAIGAIGEYGAPVVDGDLVDRLGVTEEFLTTEIAFERKELDRRVHTYRKDRPAPVVGGRAVVVVDDGIATGATLQAVLHGVRAEHPALLVCAVPVGAPDSVARLSVHVDVMVCPYAPRWFRAVGEWYDTFGQTSDSEVVEILERVRSLNED